MLNTKVLLGGGKSSRINGYEEFLRYIFTILIAVAHIWYMFYGGTYYLDGAYLGVDFFFMLTGFHLIDSYRKCKQSVLSLLVRRYKNMLLIYVGSIICYLIVSDYAIFFKGVIRGLPDILCLQSSGFFYPSVNVILWYISAMQVASFFILSLVDINEKFFLKLIAPLLVVICYSLLYHYLNNLDGTSNIKGYIIPLGLLRAFAGISLGIILNLFIKSLSERYVDKNYLKDVVFYYICLIVSLAVVGICMFKYPHSTYDFICLLAFPVLIISSQVLGVISQRGVLNRIGKSLCWLFGKQMTLAMYCFSIIIYRIVEKILPLLSTSMYVNTLIYITVLFVIAGIISRVSSKFNSKLLNFNI